MNQRRQASPSQSPTSTSHNKQTVIIYEWLLSRRWWWLSCEETRRWGWGGNNLNAIIDAQRFTWAASSLSSSPAELHHPLQHGCVLCFCRELCLWSCEDEENGKLEQLACCFCSAADDPLFLGKSKRQRANKQAPKWHAIKMIRWWWSSSLNAYHMPWLCQMRKSPSIAHLLFGRSSS